MSDSWLLRRTESEWDNALNERGNASFWDEGSMVRAETCTHYTALDRSAYAKQEELLIMAPPLRAPDDVETIFEHL